MHAEVGDEHGERHKLTASELGSFFLLLVAAGNETTRTAISLGMNLLAEAEAPLWRKLLWFGIVFGFTTVILSIRL